LLSETSAGDRSPDQLGALRYTTRTAAQNRQHLRGIGTARLVRVDLGVVRMGALGDSAMTARKLATSPRHVLGTPVYFAQFGVPATPADLLQHRAVVYAQAGAGDSWNFRQGITEVSVSVSGPLRVSAAEGVRAGVLADMGLAVASAWMFAPEMASGAVQVVLADWMLPAIDRGAVYPAGRMPSARPAHLQAF
jgi:DNA-binding transcriptional LysR family regulator